MRLATPNVANPGWRPVGPARPALLGPRTLRHRGAPSFDRQMTAFLHAGCRKPAVFGMNRGLGTRGLECHPTDARISSSAVVAGGSGGLP